MKRITIFVLGLFLFLYVLPLNVRPLLVPDEMRYAETGREMIETGDWIVPRLDGLRYFEKPILGDWLHALSIRLLGENAFAVRLPSALAVGLSALMLFFLVRRSTGEISAAIVAASVFLTCLEVYGVGTFCVLDSIFSMFVTASLIAFFFAFMETRSRKRAVFLIVSGIACGLAFLTKGFLAFVIPAIVIIPFALWQHKLAESARGLLVMFVTGVLTVLPWGIMVHLREPDFWRYFLWTEHIERFLHAKNGQHPQPFWFFIPVLAGGALPWTPVFPLVVTGLKKTQNKDSFIRFLFCWLIFPFLFFSACRGKLGTYILPCYPPLAILTTIGLMKYLAAGKTLVLSSNLRNTAIVVSAVVIALIIIQTAISPLRIYGPGEVWKFVIIIIALSVYAMLLIIARAAVDIRKILALWCLGPVLLMFASHFAMPNRVVYSKAPNEFLLHNLSRVHPDTILVSDNYLTPAVCWCYERTDVLVIDRGGELTYGLEYGDSKQRLLDIDKFKKLIDETGGKGLVTLITTARRYAGYRRVLPRPVFEDADSGFVFAQFAAGNIQATDIQEALHTRPSQYCCLRLGDIHSQSLSHGSNQSTSAKTLASPNRLRNDK